MDWEVLENLVGGSCCDFFLVDPKNNLTAVLMTQVLGADDILRKEFFKEIYKNLL